MHSFDSLIWFDFPDSSSALLPSRVQKNELNEKCVARQRIWKTHPDSNRFVRYWPRILIWDEIIPFPFPFPRSFNPLSLCHSLLVCYCTAVNVKLRWRGNYMTLKTSLIGKSNCNNRYRGHCWLLEPQHSSFTDLQPSWSEEGRTYRLQKG